MAGGVSNAIGLTINSSNPLSAVNGGTGVSNSSLLAWTASNNITLNTSGPTNITLPTSGTLVTTAVTTLSSLVSVGTLTTGIWDATVIAGQYGGTGVANTGLTITLGGNLTTSGAFGSTFTMTGTTAVTFPTSGTLATIGSNSVVVNNANSSSVTMADSAAVNKYIVTNATLCTLTLPATIALGHTFEITGSGAGGWKIAQLAGQSIAYESAGVVTATTVGTGGSLASSLSTDCAIIEVHGC